MARSARRRDGLAPRCRRVSSEQRFGRHETNPTRINPMEADGLYTWKIAFRICQPFFFRVQ